MVREGDDVFFLHRKQFQSFCLSFITQRQFLIRDRAENNENLAIRGRLEFRLRDTGEFEGLVQSNEKRLQATSRSYASGHGCIEWR